MTQKDEEAEKPFRTKKGGYKPSVLSELLATRLKTEISKIFLDALSGTDRTLRTNDGYIKWGLVEHRIHKTIDKECG